MKSLLLVPLQLKCFLFGVKSSGLVLLYTQHVIQELLWQSQVLHRGAIPWWHRVRILIKQGTRPAYKSNPRLVYHHFPHCKIAIFSFVRVDTRLDDTGQVAEFSSGPQPIVINQPATAPRTAPTTSQISSPRYDVVEQVIQNGEKEERVRENPRNLVASWVWTLGKICVDT